MQLQPMTLFPVQARNAHFHVTRSSPCDGMLSVEIKETGQCKQESLWHRFMTRETSLYLWFGPYLLNAGVSFICPTVLLKSSINYRSDPI